VGVLAALDAHPRDGLAPDQASEEAGVSLYAARVLLEACLSLGMAELVDGRYRLTRVGRLLLHDEMTRVNMDFAQDVCYLGAARLQEALRDGAPAGLRVFGDWPTVYQGLSHLPEQARRSWFAFDHFYSDAVFPLAARELVGRGARRILDVGGNTGKFAVACARLDPAVRVTILDHPGQLAMALEHAAQEQVGGQVDGRAMDLLDHSRDFPGGFDAVWMSQFLDCFPERDIVPLLRRGRAALGEGGRLFVNETFWDRQANQVGTYCLHASSIYFAAIANGTSRMYHSDDLRQCVAQAGLAIEEDRALGSTHTLLVCRPAA
jgi:ubiquinone/menaquinone biosynthesis C-methylase UbiE